MHKCDKCEREFKSYRALNGHKSSCGKEVRYSVARSEYVEYPCIQCQKPIISGKYCNAKCQQQWQWENVNKPRVIQGNGGTGTAKRYIIEEYGNKCSECNIDNIWAGKPLTLQLDHIDGNSDNNKIENLRLLCPNCHTQTVTWGSKGQGNRYKKHTKRNSYLQNYKN